MEELKESLLDGRQQTSSRPGSDETDELPAEAEEIDPLINRESSGTTPSRSSSSEIGIKRIMFEALARYKQKHGQFNYLDHISVPVMKKPRKKKVQKDSFFKQAYDVIAFCVEFVFGFCVVGGSLAYESIPSCIYILLVLIYMRQSVMMNKFGVISKLVIACMITLISFGVLVAKGVGVYLFYKRSGNQ